MRVPLCSLIALLVIFAGGLSPLAIQKRNLVGPIKNENLVSGCGCYFYFGRYMTRSSKEVFASGAAEEDAWMNIDGVDTKLKFVSRTEPTGTDSRGNLKVGSRHTEKYAVGDVTVDVVYIVTEVCPRRPVGPCEATGYSATFRVRKGRRVQVVRANGACGC